MALILADGDFTKSANWPRIKYGLPDKADILDAQNQILGAHMVKEATKREDEFELITENFDKMHKLMSALAKDRAIDPVIIASTKPTKSQDKAKQQIAEDKARIAELDSDFVSRLVTISANYGGKQFEKVMMVSDVIRVDADNLVGKWADYVEPKLMGEEQEIWTSLTDSQMKLLYFAMSSELRKAKKELEGEKPAAKKRKGAATGAAATSVDPEETPSNRGGTKRKAATTVGMPTPGGAFDGTDERDLDVNIDTLNIDSNDGASDSHRPTAPLPEQYEVPYSTRSDPSAGAGNAFGGWGAPSSSRRHGLGHQSSPQFSSRPALSNLYRTSVEGGRTTGQQSAARASPSIQVQQFGSGRNERTSPAIRQSELSRLSSASSSQSQKQLMFADSLTDVLDPTSHGLLKAGYSRNDRAISAAFNRDGAASIYAVVDHAESESESLPDVPTGRRLSDLSELDDEAEPEERPRSAASAHSFRTTRVIRRTNQEHA
ncbi:hypothetical protein LTR10_007026 [Elasticomyces elasticus]|nr:hypothetical protein LTR10_007026 [Elasticomyces elasticus]KAK4978844.1 hypothetical protein LTR42_001344 [Elasticomyces elasticus]